MKKNKQVPAGYKNSALGVIPEDWEVVQLGKKIDILTGFAFQSTSYSDNGIKLLRGSNIKRKYVDWSYEITKYWKSDPALSKYSLKLNDLVVALDGALIGSSFSLISKNDLPCYLVQRTARIRSNEINIFFIYHHLSNRAFQLYVDSVKTHTAIPHISPSDIKNYSLPLPPLPEQTAIANLLSTWDKAIQLTTALLAQKEARKKWLMQQLLTGKRRLKGFEEDIWTTFLMRDICIRITQKNEENNKTVVTVSAQRGLVSQNTFFNKIVASDTLENYFLIVNGDFCYNKSYSAGYPWGTIKRLNNFKKAVVTTLYICFRIKKNALADNDFLEILFDSNPLDKGLSMIAHEGGRAHGLLNVTPNDFFNLKIKLPSLKEQKELARLFSLINKEIDLIKEQIEVIQTQKKGLMQQLLTGKKRLKLKTPQTHDQKKQD